MCEGCLVKLQSIRLITSHSLGLSPSAHSGANVTSYVLSSFVKEERGVYSLHRNFGLNMEAEALFHVIYKKVFTNNILKI